jgi:hypothetical protein
VALGVKRTKGAFQIVSVLRKTGRGWFENEKFRITETKGAKIFQLIGTITQQNFLLTETMDVKSAVNAIHHLPKSVVFYEETETTSLRSDVCINKCPIKTCAPIRGRLHSYRTISVNLKSLPCRDAGSREFW